MRNLILFIAIISIAMTMKTKDIPFECPPNQKFWEIKNITAKKPMTDIKEYCTVNGVTYYLKNKD